MINLDHCILLGKLTKTHGVKGQVILSLARQSAEDIEKMESVFILKDELPVPFFISEYQIKNTREIILSFDDVYTSEKARSILDCPVWIDKASLDMPKQELPPDLSGMIGYSVYDMKLGKLGRLSDILELEQNPLLQVENLNKELLIPLQPEFISSVDTAEKIIYVSIPEGLCDL